MNEIINTQAEVSILSLDIAKMTGKKHSHVMRDIKVMLDTLGIDESIFGGIYNGTT